ncbi:DarT ssDNA thymidine ADP-ribosyltransferase family protein [Pseudoroseicyclus tamaricis]|uniref:DUF4433 domain-containing protein n=1 Tax=Pseudoroseicyclus tamaricis TaxID=2705421 RepID=A0A6B2JT61_9RHOB|nr:DarT ssDNA thymidine ADP-ribosyltransferase family protein [Pseudoroseicyclus tamaricis]NDV01210.1 DUF4433 domain-containing protein [Pseudoroseicyclus tamaricis]
MDTILGWQIAVVISIVAARLVSREAMVWVATGWSLFSLFAIWAEGLLLLQLGSAWGTVWLLSALFGGASSDETSEKNAPGPTKAPPPAAPKPRETSAAKPASVIDDFAAWMARLDAAQRANSDLHHELGCIRIEVEALLKRGHLRKAHDERLADPSELGVLYRESYAKLQAVFADKEEDRKPRAPSRLTIAPVPRSELPVEALNPRELELTHTRHVLKDAEQQVSKDRALLAAIDAERAEPVLPYLQEEAEKVSAHLAALSGKAAPTLAKPPASKPATALPATAQPAGKSTAPDGAAPISWAELLQQMEDQAEPAPQERRDEIERLARELRIPHLVHFTRVENLPGILSSGLMSASACRDACLPALRNDENRYDGQLDGTSLSISFPNYRMFWKYRRLAPQAEWAVLLLDPSVLWLKDCAFYPRNAADARMIRRPRAGMKSAEALAEMFAEEEGRPDWLRAYDPTDPQAEVMVYETIEPRFIETIAFETREVRGRHIRRLGGIDSLYAGPGKGLFASRQHMLTELKGGQNGHASGILQRH